MTNAELMELLIASLPYPDQIKNLDLTSSETAIRFDWRGIRFRISQSKSVEEVKDGMLSGSNIAIILEHLVKKTELLRSI